MKKQDLKLIVIENVLKCLPYDHSYAKTNFFYNMPIKYRLTSIFLYLSLLSVLYTIYFVIYPILRTHTNMVL